MVRHNDPNAVNLTTTSLLESVAELEAALETPFIPGELEAWVDTVHAATNNVESQLTEQVRTTHEQQFNEITEQDEELFRRTEILRQEDAELISEFDTFSRFAAGLRRVVASNGRNETELAQAHSVLVERGLSFVVRARTQERAIETWYSEAFLRDRGVGG